jgi:hypothetical protein
VAELLYSLDKHNFIATRVLLGLVRKAAQGARGPCGSGSRQAHPRARARAARCTRRQLVRPLMANIIFIYGDSGLLYDCLRIRAGLSDSSWPLVKGGYYFSLQTQTTPVRHHTGYGCSATYRGCPGHRFINEPVYLAVSTDNFDRRYIKEGIAREKCMVLLKLWIYKSLAAGNGRRSALISSTSRTVSRQLESLSVIYKSHMSTYKRYSFWPTP